MPQIAIFPIHTQQQLWFLNGTVNMHKQYLGPRVTCEYNHNANIFNFFSAYKNVNKEEKKKTNH